jgi:O-antigen/teichoic acid export membrane protein
MTLISIGNFIYSVIYLVFGVIGIYLIEQRNIGLLFGFLLAHIVLAAVNLWMWRGIGGRYEFAGIPGHSIQLFKGSIVFMGFAVFSGLFLRLDILMISWFQGEESVGLYGAAFKIIECGIWIIASFIGAVFPVLSEEYSRGRKQFTELYRTSFRVLLIVFIPITLIVFLWAQSISNFVFGARYAAAGGVLKLFAFYLIPCACIQLCSRVLFSAGQESMPVIFFGLGCVLNILLNFIFIPVMGVTGAVIASVTAAAIQCIAILIYCEMRIRL